jgi:hypothetical protein
MTQLRRRRFLVDGRLQFRIIAASLGYVAFYMFMMAAATFIPLMIDFRTTNPNSYRASLLAHSFVYLHRHVWPVALVVLGAVSLHSLFFSHRVAGPLYRFRQIFLALKAGKVPGQQRLRRGDYLHDEMQLINEMLKSLQDRAICLKEVQTGIANSIEAIRERSPSVSDKELALLVKDLCAQGNRLAEIILQIDDGS